MTITETRPSFEESEEPRRWLSQESPRPSRAGWWVGAAVGLGVIALAIALVALDVSLGSTTTSRTLAAASPSRAAAPAASAQGAQVAFSTPTASLQEFKVGVATDIPAGKYTFTISNGGTAQHEMLVFHPDASIDPASLPLGPDGNVNEDAPGVNKVSDGDNVDPGKSQTREIDLTQPGIYVFACNLPGHYRLGMWTKVTVH